MISRQGMLWLTAAGVVAAALAGCGNGNPNSSSGGGGGGNAAQTVSGQPAAATVKATDGLKFDPATASAKVGDVVEWDNSGSAGHNVTFDQDAAPADTNLAGGDKYQLKFTKAGQYKYQCTIHPGMTGELDVS